MGSHRGRVDYGLERTSVRSAALHATQIKMGFRTNSQDGPGRSRTCARGFEARGREDDRAHAPGERALPLRGDRRGAGWRGSGDVQQLLAVCERDGLDLAVDAELSKNVRDVRPDRLPGDEEALGDLVLA